jgi:hypothetical protein
MNEGMKLAVQALETLEKRGKPPVAYDDEPEFSDDFDKDILELFKRMARKNKLF